MLHAFISTIDPRRCLRCGLTGLILCSTGLFAAEPTIEFNGVSGELQTNLQAALSLTAEPCTAPAWRIKRLFRRSDQELDGAARALGYYQLKVKKDLQLKLDCWQADFTIEPGQPVTLQTVDIDINGEAHDDPLFIQLLKETPVRSGGQLHHGHYNSLKGKIETLAAERGYFDGQFTTRELKVDPAAGQASIKLHYHAGSRYRIGTLVLEQDTYAPELLERYLKIKAGDHYDANALQALHQALSGSGYFQDVVVKQDFQAASNGVINVRVQLVPRKGTAYRLGVGVATDTGPRFSASYEKRRVNRYGHRFESKLILSQADSSLGLEYSIPTQQPHIDQVSLRGSYQQLETDTSSSDITALGLRALGTRNGWSETRYLDWVSENSVIGSDKTAAYLLVPGISWSRTHADNRMHPRKGSRMSVEARGASEALLSDASFIQLLAGGKWIEPLGEGRVLIRADSGLSITPDLTKIPASYRFFAGGDQSVRGYGYQTLGPRNMANQVTGARYLLSGSLEYEHPIVGDWSAALFVDAGSAFDDWNDSLKYSVGVGLRWRSPVGPIRLDFAIPNDTRKDAFRIHFSMGGDL